MLPQLRPYQAAYAETTWPFARSLYLAWSPRTGKTRAEVYAIVRRQREAGVTRTLIVAPQKPLEMTWEDELFAAGFRRGTLGKVVGKEGFHFQLASGKLLDRAAILDCLADFIPPHVVTINYEALDDYYELIVREGEQYRFRKKLYDTYAEAKIGRANSSSKKIADLIRDWNPQAVVIDEAHLLTTAGAKRSMALRRIARDAQYVRLLSGTPDPRREVSYYAQYVILAPEIFGTSKERFIKTYFDLNPFDPSDVATLKESKRAEFYTKVYSVMSRIRADDVLDTRKPNEILRYLNWEPKSRMLYETLRKDSVIFEEGLSVDGTHRLTKLLRALQLCAGFLADENSGEVRRLHTTKTEAILADLGEPLAQGQRVVISYLFTAAGEELVAAINRRFGDGTAVLVNGQTKNSTEILRLFDVKETKDTPVRVIVLQEQVGAAGISLARARHLFFHSWSMDAAMHEQMSHRIETPSQVSNITYYIMKKSADEYALGIVQGKISDSVMKKPGGLALALNGGINVENGQLLFR